MVDVLSKTVSSLRWLVDNGSKAWRWVKDIPNKLPSWLTALAGFGGDIDAAGLRQFIGMPKYSPGAGGGMMAATTQGVWNLVRGAFPGSRFMGGYNYRLIAGTNKLSDHATGHAFDVGGSAATMSAIAQMLAGAFGRLPLKYLIYNRQINSGGGWRRYQGQNPHTDHVHVSTYDQGGYLQPGATLVINKTGKPEPVLSLEQWDALANRPGIYIENLTIVSNDPLDMARQLGAKSRQLRLRTIR
jgi:hypothetical protein